MPGNEAERRPRGGGGEEDVEHRARGRPVHRGDRELRERDPWGGHGEDPAAEPQRLAARRAPRQIERDEPETEHAGHAEGEHRNRQEPHRRRRLEQEDDPRDRHDAERERGAGEARRLRDLGRGQAPGAPEAVAHRAAGDERKAQRLTQAVGHEGAEADPGERERMLDVAQRDGVVAGQDRVGDDGEGEGEEQPRGGKRPDLADDLMVVVVAQLAVQEPERRAEEREDDERRPPALGPVHAGASTVAFRSSFPQPTMRPEKAALKARTTTQYITCR